MKVGLAEAGQLDAAHFELIPAELLHRANLSIERIARFVANAGQNHAGKVRFSLHNGQLQ